MKKDIMVALDKYSVLHWRYEVSSIELTSAITKVVVINSNTRIEFKINFPSMFLYTASCFFHINVCNLLPRLAAILVSENRAKCRSYNENRYVVTRLLTRVTTNVRTK